MKINILGILVDKITKKEALDKIESWLNKSGQHYIVTPNPEIVLASQKDEELKNIFNKADMVIADGIGLVFASYLQLKFLARVSGSDLTNQILKLAREKKYRVYFLNWEKGLSETEEIKKSIKNKYQPIEIEGEGIARDGKNLNLSKIQEFGPDILFIALGAPWQEKIIANFLKYLPSVKVAMAIGGTLDFVTGKIRRAPLFFRLIGLEWFWRLLCQPARINRIFAATFKFSWVVLKDKLTPKVSSLK